MSSNLSLSSHHATASKQALKILHMIRRTFQHIDAENFAFLYGAYVRTILEYCNQVKGSIRYTDCLEKVLRAATKMVTGFNYAPYNKRLKILKLYPLKTRRARGDLILAHSIFLKGDQRKFFVLNNNGTLRGHRYKLFNKHEQGAPSRVVTHWNNLPGVLITAGTQDSFKKSLDAHIGFYEHNR